MHSATVLSAVDVYMFHLYDKWYSQEVVSVTRDSTEIALGLRMSDRMSASLQSHIVH